MAVPVSSSSKFCFKYRNTQRMNLGSFPEANTEFLFTGKQSDLGGFRSDDSIYVLPKCILCPPQLTEKYPTLVGGFERDFLTLCLLLF